MGLPRHVVYRGAASSTPRELAALVSAVIMILVACVDAQKAVSRAELPGTKSSVVLYEDIKGMCSYRIEGEHETSSEFRLLGPKRSSTCPPPTVSVTDGVATVAWRDETTDYFVEVNLADLRVLRDSNRAAAAQAQR